MEQDDMIIHAPELTAESAALLRDACMRLAQELRDHQGCESAMLGLSAMFSTVAERHATAEGVAVPGASTGSDRLTLDLAPFATADVSLVAAGITKFATMAAAQFPGAAALGTEIATPLALIAWRRKAAGKADGGQNNSVQ